MKIGVRQDIGIPQVADLYRGNKTGYFPTVSTTYPIDQIIPLGADNEFYRDWMIRDKERALDKIANAKQSKINYLFPKYPTMKKSGAKAGELAFSANGNGKFMENTLSGGGTSSTQSIGMNYRQYVKERKKILDRLRQGFEGVPAEQNRPSQDSSVNSDLFTAQKLDFDIKLSSIRVRHNSPPLSLKSKAIEALESLPYI
jgi:hypothetical protein